MKNTLFIFFISLFLQSCSGLKSEMVEEPHAIGKDVDGIVEGLKSRGFSCSETASSNTNKDLTILCGNEKLTLLCRKKVFLYVVNVTFDPVTRKIISLSRTDCY